ASRRGAAHRLPRARVPDGRRADPPPRCGQCLDGLPRRGRRAARPAGSLHGLRRRGRGQRPGHEPPAGRTGGPDRLRAGHARDGNPRLVPPVPAEAAGRRPPPPSRPYALSAQAEKSRRLNFRNTSPYNSTYWIAAPRPGALPGHLPGLARGLPPPPYCAVILRPAATVAARSPRPSRAPAPPRLQLFALP